MLVMTKITHGNVNTSKIPYQELSEMKNSYAIENRSEMKFTGLTKDQTQKEHHASTEQDLHQPTHQDKTKTFIRQKLKTEL